jgi:hypothetical protein
MNIHKLCKFFGISTLFWCQVFVIVLGAFIIYRNVPYHSIICETYSISKNDYSCVMDNGFVCKNSGTFRIELRVKCGESIHTVYTAKESYCECQDRYYWNSNHWSPWVPNKFPLLSTNYNYKLTSNQTEYLEQN